MRTIFAIKDPKGIFTSSIALIYIGSRLVGTYYTYSILIREDINLIRNSTHPHLSLVTYTIASHAVCLEFDSQAGFKK